MAVQFCECMKSHGFGHFKGKNNKVCELYLNQDVKKKWKKSYDQPKQHIKKQICYFVSKSLSSQGLVPQVIMYGCESWTIKKAER